MLIDNIITYCNDSYTSRTCGDNCSYGNNCPRDCEKCLEFIHFPKRAPAPRKYDCVNMANYYTCKYSHKYTSELIYALQQLKDVRDKQSLKILSIGCGPCTDLFALDYCREIGDYNFNNIEYRGIDSARNVWRPIHKKIKDYRKDIYTVKFYYRDAMEIIDDILKVKWVPDIIVFQYVFSDMQKQYSNDAIDNFISKVASFINNDMEQNTYIILNDINLTKNLLGARERFDELLLQLDSVKRRHYHFKNDKGSHFDYGTEYSQNTLIVNPPNFLDKYNPYLSCSSAQLIIKKVTK